MLDMDGCLVLSDSPLAREIRPLPGAAELLSWLRNHRRPFLVFTNGSGQPPARYAERLRSIGLDVEPAEVLTPAVVAAEYVAATYGRGPVLAFGGPGLTEPLTAEGVEVLPLDEHSLAVAVIVGWDISFGVDKLDAACRAIWNGAELLATTLSRWLASAAEDGRHVGVPGAITAGIVHVTEASPRLLGKPSAAAMAAVTRRLAVPVTELLVAGDDLELEVRMGRRAGALTALVLTGVTDRATVADLEADEQPDLVVSDLVELLSVLS
jgi:HAD superfamily hydrolase (TIGR01450 family)